MAKQKKQPQNFSLKEILPLTENQQRTFDNFQDNHLLLHGVAGTGKTFISLYLALNEIEQSKIYQNVTIVRSVVPSRDMGFLPGSPAEKAKVYEEPYRAICSELYGRGDAYEILKQKKLVNFVTTSHLRGTTFMNTIVVIDEFQNMNFQELDTVITRCGENCKLIFSGDIRQTDLVRDKEKSGILTFMEILRIIETFRFIEFTAEDIVRSELVKSYIIAKLKNGRT